MDESPPSLASLRRQPGLKRRSEAVAAAGPGLFDNLPARAEKATDSLLPEPPIDQRVAPPAPPESAGNQKLSASAGTRSPAAATISSADLLPASPELPSATSAGRPGVDEQSSPAWTVSGLVRHVRGIVEQGFHHVTVEGEISNWRPAGSGHCYFTVKDSGAQLAAVLFRRSAALLRFQPRDGDAVKLHGQLSIYESRGQMQLIVEWMQQAGLGALLAEVQRLKEQLRREGLFDRKRPLPSFPQCIGVITSLHGAALRDIVKVCRRRHAGVRLLIYPAAVQGSGCAPEIAAGLRWFSAHPDQAEVVLVTRGGGSWEDLHGFDDERVARAIAACALPVITGIGHATDATIADAAADVCAPTPSAAAELLTAAQHRVAAHLAVLDNRVHRAASFQLLRAQQRLARLGAQTVLGRVEDSLNRRAQRVDELHFGTQTALNRSLRSVVNRHNAVLGRLARQSPSAAIPANRRRLELLQTRLERTMAARRLAAQRRAESAATRLKALSPLRVLDRGYALVYGQSGHLLRNPAEARPGEHVRARLAGGVLHARVEAPDNRS